MTKIFQFLTYIIFYLETEFSYLCIIIVKQAKNALLQQGHKSFTLDYVLDTLFY